MLTKDELEKLTNSFSDVEIAEQLNVKRTTINTLRHRLGVLSFTQKTHCVKVDGVAVNQRLITPHSHKTEGCVTFFDRIDTSAKAYFLGLIASDGTIYKNGNTCAIILQERDAAILQTFVKESGWNTTIKTRETKSANAQSQAVLYICSKHLCSTLKEWGIVPNKSLTLEILKPIPDHLQKDFIRGVWDGDGHLGEKEFTLTSGSVVFLEQVSAMIKKQTGIQMPLRKASKSYSLRGWRNSVDVIRWIYQDAHPVLERKAIQFSRYWSA